MANYAHYAEGYTGGGDALDGITTPGDGDMAVVTNDGYTGSIHRFNAGNTDSESSPWVILPDDGTSGAWEMVAKSGDRIQRVQTEITSLVSVHTPLAWNDITGLSVTITPRLSGSQIKLSGSLALHNSGGESGYVKPLVSIGGGAYSDLFIGDANGAAIRAYAVITYGDHLPLDYTWSPSYTVGQSITVKFQGYSSNSNGKGYVYVNYDGGSSYTEASTLVLTELAA